MRTQPRQPKSIKEKRDASIIGTNDYSIVSKRSVESLYHSDKPQFLSVFVPKLKRRAPLINRGYWLRMQAIEQTVRHFLTHDNSKKKIVINLGCGYDVLPFEVLHRHREFCQNTRFVDIDYPQLIEKKVEVIRNHSLFTSLLSELDTATKDDENFTSLKQSASTKSSTQTDERVISKRPEQEQQSASQRQVDGESQAIEELSNGRLAAVNPNSAQVLLRSNEYFAIGCDLNRLSSLDNIFKKEFLSETHSFLFLAEVSIAYMKVCAADSVIQWASSFPEAQFCLLEQYLPDGAGHPFASTMLDHFGKQTPLSVLHEYPQLADQKVRFLHNGWRTTEAQNLWSLWQNDEFLSRAERQAVDQIEPFDEWEEFALFSGHYFVLWASTLATCQPPKWYKSANWAFPCSGSVDNLLRMEITGKKFPPGQGQHRFAAAYITDENNVASHGGTARGLRHQTGMVYHPLDPSRQWDELGGPQLDVTCHTISAVEGKSLLLVGGRKSFLEYNQSTWLRQNRLWSRVGDLWPARTRHCAATIQYPLPGVLIFGGKTSVGEVLGEWRYWTLKEGWQHVQISHPAPSPRFGAAMACSNGPRGRNGLIIGGISADGVVLGDIWEWELVHPSEICGHETSPRPLTIRFQDRSSTLSGVAHPRFGATLIPTRTGLLLIGGVAAEAPLRLEEEIVLFSRGNDATQFTATAVCPSYREARPLLIGFSATNLPSGEVLLFGGGAVCFSFGGFWNDSLWTFDYPLSLHMNRQSHHGIVSNDKEHCSQHPESSVQHLERDTCKADSPGCNTIRRIIIHQVEHFEDLVSTATPAVIHGLPLGRCTESWTADYLKAAVGNDRPVIIHESDTPALSFQSKNFSYTTLPFGQLIERAAAGDHVYLRAVSATQPSRISADFSQDFPTLAQDFLLPASLAPFQDLQHSSVLRISGNIRMWLHYDVMANMYFQIRGRKRVKLYPPADIRRLHIPAGETTSALDVFASANECDIPGLCHTHPFEALLEPGDILFIPACWPHATAPDPDKDGQSRMSVAVNIFFRNFKRGYAAGRDVYANRDLEAYQNGRRDIEKFTTLLQTSEQPLVDVCQHMRRVAAILLGERKLQHGDALVGSREVRRIIKSVKGLEANIAKFYLDRLAQELLDKALALENPVAGP